MKDVTKFCAILAIALGSHMLYAHTTANDAPEAPVTEEYLEDNKAWPGMFFSSEYIHFLYEENDIYYIIYDDADANMFDVKIIIDAETFMACREALKSGNELVGSLVLNDDYSFDGVGVFTFMSEPEFEMAQASAKI